MSENHNLYFYAKNKSKHSNCLSDVSGRITPNCTKGNSFLHKRYLLVNYKVIEIFVFRN